MVIKDDICTDGFTACDAEDHAKWRRKSSKVNFGNWSEFSECNRDWTIGDVYDWILEELKKLLIKKSLFFCCKYE